MNSFEFILISFIKGEFQMVSSKEIQAIQDFSLLTLEELQEMNEKLTQLIRSISEGEQLCTIYSKYKSSLSRYRKFCEKMILDGPRRKIEFIMLKNKVRDAMNDKERFMLLLGSRPWEARTRTILIGLVISLILQQLLNRVPIDLFKGLLESLEKDLYNLDSLLRSLAAENNLNKRRILLLKIWRIIKKWCLSITKVSEKLLNHMKKYLFWYLMGWISFAELCGLVSYYKRYYKRFLTISQVKKLLAMLKKKKKRGVFLSGFKGFKTYLTRQKRFYFLLRNNESDKVLKMKGGLFHKFKHKFKVRGIRTLTGAMTSIVFDRSIKIRTYISTKLPTGKIKNYFSNKFFRTRMKDCLVSGVQSNVSEVPCSKIAGININNINGLIKGLKPLKPLIPGIIFVGSVGLCITVRNIGPVGPFLPFVIKKIVKVVLLKKGSSIVVDSSINVDDIIINDGISINDAIIIDDGISVELFEYFPLMYHNE